MATNAETKLYAAIGVLAVLGGALFLTSKKQKEEQASYTLSGQAATLPKLAITDDDVKGIDKVVITKAPGEDAGAGTEVELVKQGEDWHMTKPVDAAAQTANVKSMLDNLKQLKVSELIDAGKASYEKFKLGDSQGLHVVFSKGSATVLDARFGENGGRGQMTRLSTKEGVYAVKGFSNYLYDRETKGWRDTTVFKFEDSAATSVSITNEHGTFAFVKDKDTWSGKYKDAKGGALKDLERFDESKVKDLLRAYKALNADSFADPAKTPTDLGLDKPASTLLITLNDGAKREVKVGATAEGTSRWVQATGVKELVSISSWAADWALAEPKKFQKADPKDAKKEDKPMKIGGPPGMPPVEGIPAGHP